VEAATEVYSVLGSQFVVFGAGVDFPVLVRRLDVAYVSTVSMNDAEIPDRSGKATASVMTDAREAAGCASGMKGMPLSQDR